MKSSSTDRENKPDAHRHDADRKHRPTQTVRALPFGPLGPYIPSLAAAFVRTLSRTCRVVERRNEEYIATRLMGERKPVVLALWHNRIFFSLYYMDRRFHQLGVPFSLLVSASRDGELIARLIQYMKADVVRGSSSRGGREALLALMDRTDRGFTAAVTPDGPRGPRYHAHPGAVLLAQRSGLPIVPMTCGMRRSFVFKSWDRFICPLPMSPVRILFGDPIWVPKDADEGMREYFRQKLQDDLIALTTEADDWRTLRKTKPPVRGRTLSAGH